jgi:hypothetical protein
VVAAPEDRAVSGLWIDVVLPHGSSATVPLVDGESVQFEATDWGLRVPVRDIAAADTARISFAVVVDP